MLLDELLQEDLKGGIYTSFIGQDLTEIKNDLLNIVRVLISGDYTTEDVNVVFQNYYTSCEKNISELLQNLESLNKSDFFKDSKEEEDRIKEDMVNFYNSVSLLKRRLIEFKNGRE